MESNIEAIKVYQCLSKLSRSFARYESSKPHEYNLNNIRDMKHSEETKQSMLPDTSTCVVDHNEEGLNGGGGGGGVSLTVDG